MSSTAILCWSSQLWRSHRGQAVTDEVKVVHHGSDGVLLVLCGEPSAVPDVLDNLADVGVSWVMSAHPAEFFHVDAPLCVPLAAFQGDADGRLCYPTPWLVSALIQEFGLSNRQGRVWTTSLPYDVAVNASIRRRAWLADHVSAHLFAAAEERGMRAASLCYSEPHDFMPGALRVMSSVGA